MRDFKGMKRQRGRNRGGGGGGGGGGGKPNVNRAFDSNGPDNVKIRGHAQHVYEKYQQLARDASAGGDRVLAENYLQHAEHYFRVLRSLQPQRPPAEIVGRDAYAPGFDIDFEDDSDATSEEGGEAAVAEGGAAAQPAQSGEARQDERQERGEWRRDDRGEGRDRREGRRERFEGRREDRGGYGARSEERNPTETAGEPETRGEESALLRSQDGGVSEAPAFLQAPAGEEGEARRPRGRPRRRPRSFEGGAEEGEGSAPMDASDEA